MEVEKGKQGAAQDEGKVKESEVSKQDQSNNNNKQKWHSQRKYFNNQFPCNNKDLFDSEKEELTQKFEEQVKIILNDRDFNNELTSLNRKRSKLQLLYGMNSQTKQRYQETMFYLGIEEQYMKLEPLIAYPFNSNSTLNWQPFWDLVLKMMFKNDLQNTNLKEAILPETVNFLQVIKKIRQKFDDTSIQEVYDLYKKLRLSNSGQLSLLLVRYFLKISRNTPKELYSQIFQEFTLQLSYDQPIRNRLVMLTILYNLAKAHPQLDWENQYDQIFTFISRYYIQRMPLGFTYYQPQQKLYYLSIYNPQTLIMSLLIALIAPETEKEKHEKIWKNIHRLFNLIKQYLHPNYDNTPTIKFLFQQFQQFVSAYIWTHGEQQKQINNLEKQIAKLERKIKMLGAAQKQDEQIVSQQGLPGDDQDELKDQNIDTELLNDDEGGNMQMGKGMEQFKQQAMDYEGNENLQMQNNQVRFEEDEVDDEDESEDSDDEQENFDKLINEFQEKAQNEQAAEVEKYQKKLKTATEKLKIKKQFAFDKACNEQFESIIEANLINILGINDQSGNILPQICKDLCYFNPSKFIPIILDNIYEAFEKPDMNYSTAISVLTAIIIPMVDRNNYKQGLYQIPTLMKKVLDIFNTSNFQLSVKMWKLFDQIFQVVPIYNVDDLQESYLEKNPGKSYSDFYQDLNKDEEINMITFYEQLHDVTYNIFQKFLSIFEHIDMPRSKNTRGFRAAVLSVLNFFTSIAFSTSKKLFKQLWSHAFLCITDRQQLHASKFYSYLIHSFTLRDPQLVLSSMIPYLFDHILTKRENTDLTEIEKQPLYYLLQQQPNKDHILSYQIESINSNSLFWYLNLLEDTIFFGRQEILKYKTEIETIIFLCFVHTETEFSKKACQLLQKIFHSLITFYPQEMFIWSENEIEGDINFKEMYHRYIGQNSKKVFSMKWHEPTAAEVEYSKDLFFRIYNPILNHFNNDHFKNLEPLDVDNNFTQILDTTMHAPDDAPRSLKTELQRSIMLLFHLYSSIATRLKWGIDEQDGIYQKFSKTFCLPEYDNVNSEMIDFCENMINFMIKNNLFYDSNVAQVYLSLILFILGNDDQTGYINGIKNKLKEIKNQNSNPYRSYQGYPRFVEVTSVTTQFNTKVILYTFDTKLNEKHSKLLKPLLFLILHPYQKISEKSINSFLLMTDLLKNKSHYTQSLKTFCSFLQAKLCKKSSAFFPRVIEECKEKDPKLVPMLSTYMDRTITSLSVLNFVAKKFDQDYAFVLDTLMSIIESYNIFLSKDTKEKIIEIPLNQLLHLVTKLKKLDIAYNLPIQKLGIYKEKSKVLQEILSQDNKERTHQLQGEQKMLQIKDLIKQLYDRCLLNLEDPTVFSKEKIFMIIIAMKTANFADANDERFQKILENAINFTNYDNLHSRNIGRAMLFKCIRTIKNQYKKREEKMTIEDNYVKDQNKPLEELSAYFLFKKQDIDDGYYTNRHQDFILYKKSTTYLEHKKDSILYQKFSNKEFLNAFLDHILNDITTHTMAEQSLKPKNIFNTADQIFQQEFVKNFKKKNFFSDGPSFFHMKLLKKIFGLIGMQFFEAAKVHLEKHKNDYSTLEGSTIMSVLTFSCLLGIFQIEQDATQQEKEEAYNYLMEIVIDRAYQLNLEQFSYFMKYLETVIESVSFSESQRILDDIYKSPKLSNQQDPKYQRYLYTKLLQLNKFNIKNQEILDGLINELKTVNPSSIQQLPIYNLVHNAVWSYHQISIDFNFCKKYNIVKDLDQLVEQGRLRKIDQFQAIKINPQINQIYDFILNQINSEDPEVKKKYYRLAKVFSSIFKEDHLFKTEIYNSMKSLFPYFIEFKEEDIADAQLVQEFWSNLIFLSIPLYNKETVLELLELCYKNFKNTNWRIRQRALLFNQFIAFFNLYRIGDFNYIDPLLELMNDEQKQNKSIAQKVLSLVIKTLPVEQVGGFVERMQKMAVSEDKNQKIIAVYCLMSVLLSYPHEIKEWTENAIRTILKNKNISPDTLTLLKEFGAAFLRNAFHNKVESKLKLPEDLIIRLEEISRPHNYFA
ncbi:hypothetical protein ABPG74_020213 [Tetrahymena malaccensis]